MDNYKHHLTYLVGCYTIIADLEINALELDILDSFLGVDSAIDLHNQRQLIFSDDEEKISLSSLIDDLQRCNLSNAQKDEIIFLLADIAYADGYLDSRERDIIVSVGNALGINIVRHLDTARTRKFEDDSKNSLKWYERIRGTVDKTVYNLSINKSKNFLLERLLGGPAFAQKLENVTKDATVDIVRVSDLLQQFNKSLTLELEHLAKIDRRSKHTTVEEVNQMLDNTMNHIRDIVENSLQNNINVLEKKKRNMPFFTIAFMGRTKAGKSTLHKVITLQEYDDIGVGKLRTTRYNRSWYWDRLRIVDTPGIGAPGGETDTQIAQSIIDEADMICYVVTNDSIQETEFDFFDTIKERNKPLYIIINVKSNLSEPIRLKKFLKDPSDWRTSKGPQSLDGHIHRIYDMLDGKYNIDAVQIIPLHLLASKLSFSEDLNPEIRKVLFEGSNIDEFVLSIKKEIFDSGTLKKSMSIIDGSAFQIHTIHTLLSDDYSILSKSIENLRKSYTQLREFLDLETDHLKTDLAKILDTAQNKLKNRATVFAEVNYDNSSASDEWAKDANVKSINKRADDSIKARIEDFSDKLKAKMEEIISDMMIMSNKVTDFSVNINGENISNTKLAVGIIGSIATAAVPLILSVVLSNPAGWVLAVAGIAASFITGIVTSLFTSKAEKIQRAQEKMREQLFEEIDKSMEKSKSDIQDNVNSFHQHISKELVSSIGEYIIQSETILQRMKKLIDSANRIENVINSLVSFRILNYIGRSSIKDQKIDKLSNDEIRLTFPVERDWGSHSITYKYLTKCSEADRLKAVKATQMNINF